jgi:hypothetical protein
MSDFDRLPEAERIELARQADAVLALLLRRHGVKDEEMPELLEAIRWIREHRAFMQKLQLGGLLTTLSLLVTGLAAAIVEGVKSLMRGAP